MHLAYILVGLLSALLVAGDNRVSIVRRGPGAVSVTKPNKLDVWSANSTQVVSWKVIKQNLAADTLDIQLRNAYLAYYVANNVPAMAQNYTVTIPEDVPPGIWFVRVTDFMENNWGDSASFSVRVPTTTSLMPSTMAAPSMTVTPAVTISPPARTCEPPYAGCFYGTFDSASCRCVCTGQIGNVQGWCPDAGGRCLKLRQWDPFTRQFAKCQ